ncbi:MAG: hypothetical protein BWY66_02781 [bacterium ADurb.Bin374]|nr:MAG: hypothetical protein BWY66_02781 [bacterium ADurb.Bin374]
MAKLVIQRCLGEVGAVGKVHGADVDIGLVRDIVVDAPPDACTRFRRDDLDPLAVDHTNRRLVEIESVEAAASSPPGTLRLGDDRNQCRLVCRPARHDIGVGIENRIDEIRRIIIVDDIPQIPETRTRTKRVHAIGDDAGSVVRMHLQAEEVRQRRRRSVADGRSARRPVDIGLAVVPYAVVIEVGEYLAEIIGARRIVEIWLVRVSEAVPVQVPEYLAGVILARGVGIDLPYFFDLLCQPDLILRSPRCPRFDERRLIGRERIEFHYHIGNHCVTETLGQDVSAFRPPGAAGDPELQGFLRHAEGVDEPEVLTSAGDLAAVWHGGIERVDRNAVGADREFLFRSDIAVIDFERTVRRRNVTDP